MCDSTQHVHVNHDACIEANVLKGEAGEVRLFAEQVIAERSVRHGQSVMLPDDADSISGKPLQVKKSYSTISFAPVLVA